MANVLEMAKIHAIIGLLEQEWSYRRIARELGVDRETVACYDRLRSKSAIPAPGSEGADSSSPAISTTGSGHYLLEGIYTHASERSAGRVSQCEPFSAIIKCKLNDGLSAQRIWQDLVAESGFTGSYSSVKRFVHRLGESTPLPFRRMECEPGQEAQVDFGSGAWVIEDGKRRRPHIFPMSLVVIGVNREGHRGY